MKKYLSYGKQFIDKKDISGVTKTLKSNYLATGPLVRKFEKNFEKKFDVKHAISCSSGTAALHLALLAIGVKKGDVIILPVINFIASVNMSYILGAKIIFSDVDGLYDKSKSKKIVKNIDLIDEKITSLIENKKNKADFVLYNDKDFIHLDLEVRKFINFLKDYFSLE